MNLEAAQGHLIVQKLDETQERKGGLIYQSSSDSIYKGVIISVGLTPTEDSPARDMNFECGMTVVWCKGFGVPFDGGDKVILEWKDVLAYQPSDDKELDNGINKID